MTDTATKNYLYFLLIILLAGFSYLVINTIPNSSVSKTARLGQDTLLEEKKESDKLSKEQTKKARNEYYFTLLRDPKTNTIPDNIRARELNHARSVPTLQEVNRRLKAKNPNFKPAQDFTWQLAGPTNVGGRTRALGIDQRDPSIVIAGGVSGGIWRSTDNGNSWTLRTPDAENFSVSSLAQDPTNPDTWYYTSGELISSSAGAPGAPYSGTGIFRSTDNGISWTRIPGTEDDNTQFDSQFDYVNRIAISPTTGTVFIASNGLGIFRSPDGNTFNDLNTCAGWNDIYMLM
ncbi:MAG: hypothetical protein U5J95_06115 [Balneolaceae bacterium]|nr:hypothetical protein [Balneolaceae bacterium]